MRYTDKFFEFPIRIYDGMERLKVAIKQDKQLEINPDDVEEEDSPWVRGTCAILPEHIISFNETMSFEKTIDDIIKEGEGNMTRIELKEDRVEVCAWPLKKFKEKLNAFVEKYNAEKDNDSIKPA